MEITKFIKYSENKSSSVYLFNSYVTTIEFWAEQNSKNCEFIEDYRKKWIHLESINARALYDLERMGEKVFCDKEIWNILYKQNAINAINKMNEFVQYSQSSEN